MKVFLIQSIIEQPQLYLHITACRKECKGNLTLLTFQIVGSRSVGWVLYFYFKVKSMIWL